MANIITKFDNFLNEELDEKNTEWTENEISKLENLEFEKSGDSYKIKNSKINDKISSVVFKGYPTDYIIKKIKENSYNIQAKFPTSRFHFSEGDRKAIKGFKFNDINKVMEVIKKMKREIRDSEHTYGGTG
jgi:hypothetical protein